MQFALCRAPIGDGGSAADLIGDSRLSWLRFGHDYFCYGADLSVLTGRFAAAGLSFRRLSTPPKLEDRIGPEHLHLVIQEGSQFKRAHPQAAVLLDKGRHMLVALDPRHAGRLAQNPTRYSLRPVAGNQVIYEVATRAQTAPKADARTKRVLDALNRHRYADTLTELTSYPARHSLSSHFQDAARRCRNRLQMMGYDARLEEVDVAGGKTLNVVAEKAGAGAASGKAVLLTAHLDTIHPCADDTQPEDITALAPGVNDNGSGSAGVLEMARIFKDEALRGPLCFILFGGQEQGLHGSTQYVERLGSSGRAHIGAVVNMDMIGVARAAPPTVLLEGGAAVSSDVMAGLACAAETYTKLNVHTSYHYHSSDHVPFIDAGVPAVLTIEGSEAPNDGVHGAADTLHQIDYDYALDILRMNTAFVVTKVGR